MKKFISLLFVMSAFLTACGGGNPLNNSTSDSSNGSNTETNVGDGHTYTAKTKDGNIEMQYNITASLTSDMVGEWKATFALNARSNYYFYCDGTKITNIGPDRDNNGNYIPWVTNYDEGGLAKAGIVCDVFLKKYKDGGYSVFAEPVVSNWVVGSGNATFELKPNTEADLQNGAFYELYAEVNVAAGQRLTFYTDKANGTTFPDTVVGKNQSANNVSTDLIVKKGGRFTVYLSLSPYDVYQVWASTPAV